MKTYDMKCLDKTIKVKALIETRNLILTHSRYNLSLTSKSRSYSLSIKNKYIKNFGDQDLFLKGFSGTSLKAIKTKMLALEALDLSRDCDTLSRDMNLKRFIEGL